MKDPAVDNAEENKLIGACLVGDLSAFEKLVARHQRGLYNIALRISGSEEDAADIVQETFLSAWRKRSDFRGEAKFSTWLTSIAINQARELWRRDARKRAREQSLDRQDETCGGVPPQMASEQPSALELLEELQLRELLDRCIQALDRGFREVLILRDMRDMAYEEVGKILGLREGTVKSRLFRAREAVRECVNRGLGKQ